MNLFKRLLPTGRAWSLTANKNLRKFFAALHTVLVDSTKSFADYVYFDIFPATTRELSAWDKQFGLPTVTMSDAERRTRIEGAWSSMGGQSPRYLQDALQAHGFDVYVHEWWESISPVVARNPFDVLSATYLSVVPGVDCGEPLAECGEAFAECGNFTEKAGYPLVNKLIYNSQDTSYTVPSDPGYFPYFIYVGGVNFGDVATVAVARRYEFEALLLKLFPAHLWIGVIVRYS